MIRRAHNTVNPAKNNLLDLFFTTSTKLYVTNPADEIQKAGLLILDPASVAAKRK